MKITDSKGLVVRVGGTIHVDGATTPPPAGPPALPLHGATTDYAAAAWDAARVYWAGSYVLHNGRLYFNDTKTPAGKEPGTADGWYWYELAGDEIASMLAPAVVKVGLLPQPYWPQGRSARFYTLVDDDTGRKIYYAEQATDAADIPGASPKWQLIGGFREWILHLATPLSDAISALEQRNTDNDERLNDLTDASPSIWDAATIYQQGSVVRHNGSTWLAKVATTAGDEPTSTSVVWTSITLESLLARIVALETKPSPAPPTPPGPAR